MVGLKLLLFQIRVQRLDEIIPRHSAPLHIVTDNGTENINKEMEYTLEQMSISHVTTSYHHPEGNSKVERFHRTLHDVMSKRVSENVETWDIYFNQVLAAISYN